jgi:hypothetical protein
MRWSTTRRAARGARSVYGVARDRATLMAAALLEPLIALGPAAAIVIAEPLLIGPVLLVLLLAAAWTMVVRWWHQRSGGAADRPED